jgi:secreted PhoX family phosphatase
MSKVSRRRFLRSAGRAALGLAVFRAPISGEVRVGGMRSQAPEMGFGPLVGDAQGILDLPRGFSHRLISRAGETMKDGFMVPGNADGMAAFPGPDGLTLVLRNHEVWSGYPPHMGAFGNGNELLRRVRRNLMYDRVRSGPQCLGGVTTLVFDTGTQELRSQFLSLCGTLANCSGGPTPWGSWISCEEEFRNRGFQYSQPHGYAFEVEVRAEPGIQKPRPLKAMGRFIHEGAAFDPLSSAVYLTEDQSDSLLYRFLPEKPGDLAAGGRLQCLSVRGNPGLDTRNWRGNLFPPGSAMPVEWIDLEDVDGEENDLRLRGYEKGGARFANGEGIAFGNGAVFFACTYGGRTKTGQIWRYVPSPEEGTAGEKDTPGRLELFVQPDDGRILFNPDQMTVSPWGDLLVCEDNPRRQYLMGITPQGKIYTFARNIKDDSELAGVCFSPDKTTMFLNLQNIGYTLAITGPWKDPRDAAR